MKVLTSLKIAAAVTASLGLAVGFGGAGVASALPFGSHHHSFPTSMVGSGNVATSNDTSIKLTNNNPQNAVTGSATVVASSHHSSFRHHHNSGSGTASATSGTASNTSTASANVSVHNQAAVPADMPSVPQGVNVFHSGNTSTDSETRICITNNNEQTAVSGSATVEGNVEAGSATSGEASNTSTTSFTVSVNN